MLFEIKHRFTGAVLFSLETESLKLCVEAAVNSGVSLDGASLDGAWLDGASLDGASLACASLNGASLDRASLDRASLDGASLDGASLNGAWLNRASLNRASLNRASLDGASLNGAWLHGASLNRASLDGASLNGASLDGASLHGASLNGASLNRASLNGASGIGGVHLARTRILPQGSIIGWKKCGDVIVKLRIPEEAKRSHAWGRKCRAEYADVLEVIGAKEAFTNDHGPKTVYRAGERVYPDKWDDDWTQECSHGIHFYITKEEAEAHY